MRVLYQNARQFQVPVPRLEQAKFSEAIHLPVPRTLLVAQVSIEISITPPVHYD